MARLGRSETSILRSSSATRSAEITGATRRPFMLRIAGAICAILMVESAGWSVYLFCNDWNAPQFNLTICTERTVRLRLRLRMWERSDNMTARSLLLFTGKRRQPRFTL